MVVKYVAHLQCSQYFSLAIILWHMQKIKWWFNVLKSFLKSDEQVLKWKLGTQ
jgi:hypothetical protein